MVNGLFTLLVWVINVIDRSSDSPLDIPPSLSSLIVASRCHSRLFLTRKPTDPVWCVCHHNAELFRFVTPSHGLAGGRLVALSLPRCSYVPWPSTRHQGLMDSFINFQGQVFHLAQRDTCVFNYVDNLIAFYGQGPRLMAVGGSAWFT